jgi:DNA modification methylase
MDGLHERAGVIPHYDQGGVRLYAGDVRAVLAALPQASVHCAVTSPPYYGLRAYGTELQIWGGDPACLHEWGAESVKVAIGNNSGIRGGDATDAERRRWARKKSIDDGNQRLVTAGAFCAHCGAWRGEFGQEPTLDLYVKHLVEIFRGVRRVLRDDGTCWLNIGDSFNAGTNATRKASANVQHGYWENGGTFGDRRVTDKSSKPKDLMLVPFSVALALRSDGAASPAHMRDIERWIDAVTASYDSRDQWPDRIAAEVERLEREHIDANRGGWYVRQTIIWSKRAPMPESVTDRPTTAHEYVFLLSKRADYYYDAEAVKEQSVSDHPSGNGFKRAPRLTYQNADGSARGNDNQWTDVGGSRNMRSVWHLGPSAFPAAHFATFPPEIPRRAILAGTSAKGVCAECGTPWRRLVEKSTTFGSGSGRAGNVPNGKYAETAQAISGSYDIRMGPQIDTRTVGWEPQCRCDAPTVPATVLDPFVGSGTTCAVARLHGRNSIGIDLSETYLDMAIRERLGQGVLMLGGLL